MRWGREHGLRTVLTRVVLDVENVAVGPRVPARTELRYRFEHARDAGGAVRRLFFSTWLRTDAPPVEGGGPVDRPSGAPRVVARAYGQRTFARLDAPPGQRSVTELPHRGVPPHVGQSVDARSLLELPPGAVPLDDAPRPSPLRVVFGLSHTDANQHVNFMAYPRYLEQAALGRSVELGRGAEIMARRVELGYRRPSFAGEIIRLVLRAFALGDDLGVCAAFVDDADDAELARTFEAPDRVRCAARMLLTR
jgi:hypothetical protein